MVKPGKSYAEAFVMEGLSGKDILILRADDPFAADELAQLEARIRQENPQWDGLILVLRTDQTLEKIPEPMARALYEAMQRIFEAQDGSEEGAQVEGQ